MEAVAVAQTIDVSADIGGEIRSPTSEGDEHASSLPSQPRFVIFFQEVIDKLPLPTGVNLARTLPSQLGFAIFLGGAITNPS